MSLKKSGKVSRFSVIILSALGIITAMGGANHIQAAETKALDDLNAGVSKIIETKKDSAEEPEETAGAQRENSKDKTVSGNAALMQEAGVEKALTEENGSRSTLVIANVEDSLNVRKEAAEEAEVVGKIYKDCAGEVLERGGVWSKIRSGNVEGWAKNEYLLFDRAADERAKEVGKLTAKIETESLRVRKEAHEEAEVYTLLAEGEEVKALSSEGEWVKVQVDSDTVGYVAADYVAMETKLEKGETIEEIKAREEAEAKKKAEAEEKKKAEAEAKKKEEVKKAREEATAKVKKTKDPAVASTASDVVLLASLIQCEANYEPYDGKVAVGTVVMNRLRSGRYGSVYDVIYAPGQFGPAGSGRVAAVVAQGPTASNIQAATDALNGVNAIGTATHFRNTRSGYAGVVIGNHVFW